MKARDLIQHVVRLGAVPIAKQASFRKSGFNFYRRNGSTRQVFNFQLSRGNAGSDGWFYINVGIDFDDVRGLLAESIVEKPVPSCCHFNVRLQELIDGVPPRIEVSSDTQLEPLAAQVSTWLQPLIELLDQVDSPDGMLKTELLDRGFRKLLRAQLLHLTGDDQSALADVRAVAQEFSDRPGLTVPNLLARYGMPKIDPAAS